MGNSASRVSIGHARPRSAMSASVVAWMPWVMCSSSVHSMIRSRVGSTSRGSPGSSPTRVEAAPEGLLPELRVGRSRRGGRLLERAPPARRQLPEHLAADLAPRDEAALEQPAAGTAHLRLVDLEQAAQLRAAQLRRAVEHAQEVVGLRPLGHGGLRRHALEPPVREGDGRVEPPDQLRIAVGSRAGVAEGVERGGQGLVVAFEQGVDQAERHGLAASRLRVEPRDPPHQGGCAGVYGGRGHARSVARSMSSICQV